MVETVKGAADGVTVEIVESATDEVRELIDELDRALAVGYLPEQQHGLPVEEIFQPHIRFFVARLDGIAAGCGGVAFFPTYAEVKRMYVRETARGRGIARAVLERLESETVRRGLDTLRLETGDLQHAAIRLYEGAGFERCAPFAAYASMTSRQIASCIFYEKQLDLTNQ